MIDPPKFQIRSHRLENEEGNQVPFVRSPNQGGMFNPRYLIMHYTAGRNAASSIQWLTNRDARASAHIVIGRDGSVTQLVGFNRRAWHAGQSEWNGLVGMSRHSIGIELDNAGVMTRRNGRWFAWFNEAYPDEEVVEATHKHHTTSKGWHSFTPIQLRVATGVATAIVRKYSLLDVIGHDDISPTRKVDPGPAFPMLSFRSMVMGREEEKEEVFETIGNLNIRFGPGTEFDKLSASPLPRGTRVIIQNTHETWKYVEVIHELGQEGCGVRGWVSGRFLSLVEDDDIDP